jgi:uncharacterized membrane protein
MIQVLRLLHILSGAFWYGAVIFTARFLMPSLEAAGPAAGPVMMQLTKRGLSQAIMGAAIVNVVAGVWLMFIVSGGDVGTWMKTSMGRTLALGATFAIVAMIVGMILNVPAAKRLGAIGAAVGKRGGPPTPEEIAEMTRLQGRLRSGAVIVAVLLTLAVAAMAVGRYV